MKADILAKIGMSGQKSGHFITVSTTRYCGFMSVKKADKNGHFLDLSVS